MPRRILILLAAMLLGACTHFSPAARRENADTLAAARGWQPLRLPAREFVLSAYAPASVVPANALAIYIEGDGLAWLSAAQPSDDPTPLRPVALELALRQERGAAAYLARPCQFVQGEDFRGCETAYWTDRRFSAEVIDASNRAIDALKQRYRARQLILVGYSGGGAVAALVAARRSDVVRLVTVAGNLDPVAWAKLHGVPPLAGSLNPADAWRALQDIPQLHFVGSRDTNITRDVVAAYVSRFPADRQPAIRMVDGATHTCCWAEKWAALWPQAFP
ncbi:alpha/beta hydrolase [Cupriavidus basilensis]|uniref:alpha/beta hydrolase n=1 Tax=Cupriavidus basilensis TaxID=68895 RepID=UPI0020A67EC3|nr:alpha/beta hydrolase [Cupriavidus basilensis]